MKFILPFFFPLACPKNCTSCSSADRCNVCEEGLYLLLSNFQCVTCSDPGMIKREDSKQCFYCIDFCSSCSSDNTCQRCESNYFLENEKSCVPIKYILPKLQPTSRNNQFILSFNATWEQLLYNITSRMQDYINLKIQGIADSDYTYRLYQSESSCIMIIENNKVSIPKNTLLELNITKYDWLLQGRQIITNFSLATNFAESLIACRTGETLQAGNTHKNT
jgi:hypothetical protein